METPSCPYHDPFKKARQENGAMETEVAGEKLALILGHKGVRTAARDHETFSSDAPFRVPIPSEEDARSVRQLPIETNPPEHKEYRAIVEPFFRRPLQKEYIARIEALIDELVDQGVQQESVEIVSEFALPLQSRALTYLLDVPENEADIWVGWGVHVFRDGNSNDSQKGKALDNYLHEQLDQAEQNPGDDFFSALTKAEYQGQPLTRDQMLGFANLTFAGGRDTVIHSISSTIAYLSEHPEALVALRENPKLVITATEELMRYISPITQIGRVCPVATDVHGVQVEADSRVALNWASANFDETVFDSPEEVRLDRKPNPHIAFGNGTHNCLGAIHARLIIRSLLKKLSKLKSITQLSAERSIEKEVDYERALGFKNLTVTLDQ
ncbi:MAG: cytochrome P450 [Akkermansiaceae bacterium]|jgi:cytochrome P450|nr:cytochrome P450 [Akkermansiaceae bacterium]